MIPLARQMYLWYGHKPIDRLGNVPPESAMRGHVYLVAHDGEFLAYVVSRSVFVDTTWEDVLRTIVELESPDRVAYVAHAYKDSHWAHPLRYNSYGYYVWKMPREQSPLAWAEWHLDWLAKDRAEKRSAREARDAEYNAAVNAQHNALYDV